MWSKYSLKFFPKGTGTGTGTGLCQSLTKMLIDSDPVVGHHIIKLQRQSLLIRADARDLEVLKHQDGFTPRISAEHLKAIRFSNVERYQKFNEDPFAWGACGSLQDLMYFLQSNKSHTDRSWIHKFYGKATPLILLKLEAGIDSEGYDKEKEKMVIEHIPFSQFIASTCPKYREKFLSGGLVPNAMHEYNSDLPKTMRQEDLHSESSVLTWLMINNSEKTFTEICQTLFGNVGQENLQYRFKDDPKLIDAINCALGTDAPALHL